ncbi:MAG TPA: glycosyltransferase [Solirubrobacteraceae bacterium]|nr:glycosyltransferase [Solirubrobacteraceae bacterium]
MRVAVVGISEKQACGVRDHATLLAGALERRGLTCSMHWITREARGARASVAELSRFRRRLERELADERPDAILVHYSVFAYSLKGLPVGVPAMFATLRRVGVPVVGVLHEYAYPWRYGGWRGAVWAISQRAVMPAVMRSLDGAIVTAEQRERWLRTRRWLPSRPVANAPVFSNLPAPRTPAREAAAADVIGLFGYAYQGAASELVLDALASLREQRGDVELRLLGWPGPDAPGGAEWLRLAGARGVAHALSFTGPLPAQELSDQIAACEVLLFADRAGPSSRKGSLAGSLASGRPIVAIDGPMTWDAFRRAGALRVVAPNAAALRDELATLLADRGALEAQGARGLDFYEREMSLGLTAERALELLSLQRARAVS